MKIIRVEVALRNGSITGWDFPCEDADIENNLIPAAGSGSGEVVIKNVVWPEELQMLKGLAVSADELNFLAKSIERFDDSEYDQFMAAASLERSPDLERLINLSFNINHYTVVRDVSDLAGIGKYHLLNTRGCLTKTELESTDFAQVGRDLLSSGKGVPTEYGLLFENEEVPFRQVYDGTVFPPYVYKGDVVAIVNLNHKGKTEYLYLPEEDISIEKAMKRLGAPCLDDCTMELEIFNCPDKFWRDGLENNFDIAGLREANYLAEVLARPDIDLYKLRQVTDYVEVVAGDEIQKLADHLDDFIVIKGAETYADVGEYITQHEEGYEVGENMPDFVDYSKLGEFIMQEREGEFMGGCFVCMEDGCDYALIIDEKPHTMEMEGM